MWKISKISKWAQENGRKTNRNHLANDQVARTSLVTHPENSWCCGVTQASKGWPENYISASILNWLVVWTSLKNMSSSIGMMKFQPNISGKIKQNMATSHHQPVKLWSHKNHGKSSLDFWGQMIYPPLNGGCVRSFQMGEIVRHTMFDCQMVNSYVNNCKYLIHFPLNLHFYPFLIIFPLINHDVPHEFHGHLALFHSRSRNPDAPWHLRPQPWKNSESSLWFHHLNRLIAQGHDMFLRHICCYNEWQESPIKANQQINNAEYSHLVCMLVAMILAHKHLDKHWYKDCETAKWGPFLPFLRHLNGWNRTENTFILKVCSVKTQKLRRWTQKIQKACKSWLCHGRFISNFNTRPSIDVW